MGLYGYFVGGSSYEILSITDNRMRVRVQPGNPFGLVSYFLQQLQDAVPTDYTT
jgi:hypothetical protein